MIIELIVRWKNDIQIDVDKVTDWPNVSIIVAVHNEEKYIERKLQNIRQLAYPGVLELVVVSDGSTDKTNAIIESQDDVAAYSYQPARGKPSAFIQQQVEDLFTMSSEAFNLNYPDEQEKGKKGGDTSASAQQLQKELDDLFG